MIRTFQLCSLTFLTLLALNTAQAATWHDGTMLYLNGTNGHDYIFISERSVPNYVGTTGLTAGNRNSVSSRLGITNNWTTQVVFDRYNVMFELQESATFDKDDVDRLLIEGLDGDDVIYNNTSIPSRIRGGRGNDLLSGGGGNDDINGDGDFYEPNHDGADVLYGNGGEDTLRGGGTGAKFGYLHIAGADELYGGPGRDTLYGQRDLLPPLVGAGEIADYLNGQDGMDFYYFMTWDYIGELNQWGGEVANVGLYNGWIFLQY